MRNSQNSTQNEDTLQRSTRHREGRQTDSLKERPIIFENLHIVRVKTSQTKVETF